MRIFGNILWLIFGGLEMAIGYFVLGAIACVTIIGIPFGLECFKIGKFAIWPIGTKVETYFSYRPVANVIWLIFGGFALALGYFVGGLVLCITIIGIPFGKQYFKLARLALGPFGSVIKR